MPDEYQDPTGPKVLNEENTYLYLDNFSWIVVRNLCHPSGSYAVSSVDQDHWDDGDVPFRLNLLVVVQHVLQDGVVVRIEDHPEVGKFQYGIYILKIAMFTFIWEF